MVTLDFSTHDPSPDELRALIQDALIEAESQSESSPTALRINEATYRRIQSEAPGMKGYVDSTHTEESFYGLRLIII